MWDGMQILNDIIDAGATVHVLDRAYIDLTSPIGRGFMAFISALAEDERERIIKRTREGRAIAKENGVKMGPKFSLNETQRAEARHRLANGEPGYSPGQGLQRQPRHHLPSMKNEPTGSPATFTIPGQFTSCLTAFDQLKRGFTELEVNEACRRHA
jgi:hypothetical protein